MDIHPLAFSVVVEMVSQMGMESVSGFKNFLDALKNDVTTLCWPSLRLGSSSFNF